MSSSSPVARRDGAGPRRGLSSQSKESENHFIHFFKDDKAAQTWTATRPGTSIITLEQGMALGRMKNTWQFGEGLAAAVTPSTHTSYM